MKKVAVLVNDGVHGFGLGVIAEVWNEPYHPDDDTPVFDYTLCTTRPGRVQGQGLDYYIENDLSAIPEADLVCIAPADHPTRTPPEALEAIRAASANGAIIAGHCSAAFVIGEAGLLDGRECTTHWRYSDKLAARYPKAIVTPDVLYVHDDNILTGAGSAAGLDAYLYLLRKTFGSRVATATARRIVIPPHRDGGQCQFVRTRVGDTTADTLGPVLEWVLQHLDQPLPVSALADRAHMSQRTFARRFREETGTTPIQWVTSQRLGLAEELLESTRLSIEDVAQRCGFVTAAALRHHFSAARGTTPQAYRKTFGLRDAVA